MKRVFAILTVALFAASMTLNGNVRNDSAAVSVTENDASARYVTRNFDYKNFTGIEAGGIVDIHLVKSPTYKVEISLPEDLEPYLRVSVSGGELKIHLDNLPPRIARRMGDVHMDAEVAMPVLTSLEMSGAAKLHTEEVFDIQDKTFKLDLGGATKVNKLTVNAKSLDAEMGGATVAAVEGNFEYASIEMAGASKASLSINADKLVMDISGASKPTLQGEMGTVKLEVSGASDFNWSGSARNMSVEASGAAKVRASGSPVDKIRVETSGAAKCDVNALEYLSIDASGASDVHYVDNPDMKLDIISVARGASVARTR